MKAGVNSSLPALPHGNPCATCARLAYTLSRAPLTYTPLNPCNVRAPHYQYSRSPWYLRAVVLRLICCHLTARRLLLEGAIELRVTQLSSVAEPASQQAGLQTTSDPSLRTGDGSTKNVKEVRMTHCRSLPCNVKLADKPRFEVDFVAERDSNVMRLRVQGQVGPLKPENFPGFKSDACSNMGVECPLVAGKQYTAKSQLTMFPTFPP
ncbi:hypothetical protein HPB47_024947, partial [Ixodes persulcatus]